MHNLETKVGNMSPALRKRLIKESVCGVIGVSDHWDNPEVAWVCSTHTVNQMDE